MRIKQMRRRRQNDQQYLDDDEVRDGEVVRTRMTLADHALVGAASALAPPRPPFATRRGYVTIDTRSPMQDSAAAYYASRAALQDEWKRHGPQPCCDGCADSNIAPPHSNELIPVNNWPKRQWPRGGYTPDPGSMGLSQWPDPDDLQSQREGDICMTNAKEPGTLRRGQNGDLVCVANRGRDAAQPISTTTGGGRLVYAEGDECRLPNGQAGTLRRGRDGLVCTPNRRDQAASNIGPPSARAGFEWAEGGECTCENGDDGLYVRQGDMLVCKARSDFDADARSVDFATCEARRDAAWRQSVIDAENEWRKW
jgi:hypothetical protein